MGNAIAAIQLLKQCRDALAAQQKWDPSPEYVKSRLCDITMATLDKLDAALSPAFSMNSINLPVGDAYRLTEAVAAGLKRHNAALFRDGAEGWRPIEEAERTPANNIVGIWWDRRWRCAQVHWDNGSNEWVPEQGDSFCDPDYFIPLPPPPSSAESKEEESR